MSNKIESSLILDFVMSIHKKEEDWEEGDLEDRISSYEYYQVLDVDIDNIDLDEFLVDEDYVSDVVGFIKNSNYNYNSPVLDADYGIIDGIHRLNALYEMGYKKVKVYKGIG